MPIVLNSPVAPDLVRLNKYLESVNKIGWYTNFGPLHQVLTERLELYLGVKNLLLVSNGTLALQVACKTLGITNTITTPFSFVATTSALLWQNIQTQFCDINSKSYNLSPVQAEKGIINDSKVNGVVATHVYGNPCDVNAFNAISQKYNTQIVYDAAHAFGVKVKGKSILNFGDASTLSFHATKVFHTIEGGAIVFKHKDDYEKAKCLINFGLDSEGRCGNVGINAKLNEYQCAVGLTLLDRIDEIINHRVELFNSYRRELNNYVEIPRWHLNASLNGAYFPIFLENQKKYDNVCRVLKNNDIQFRPYFKPSLDVVFPSVPSANIKTAQHIARYIVCLPLHFYMKNEDVLYVVKCIKSVLRG